MISYGMIRYKIELDRSALEEYVQTKINVMNLNP